jgi:hypothetical protein
MGVAIKAATKATTKAAATKAGTRTVATPAAAEAARMATAVGRRANQGDKADATRAARGTAKGAVRTVANQVAKAVKVVKVVKAAGIPATTQVETFQTPNRHPVRAAHLADAWVGMLTPAGSVVQRQGDRAGPRDQALPPVSVAQAALGKARRAARALGAVLMGLPVRLRPRAMCNPTRRVPAWDNVLPIRRRLRASRAG